MKEVIATYYPETEEIFMIHDTIENAKGMKRLLHAFGGNLEIGRFSLTDEEYNKLISESED